MVHFAEEILTGNLKLNPRSNKLFEKKLVWHVLKSEVFEVTELRQNESYLRKSQKKIFKVNFEI